MKILLCNFWDKPADYYGMSIANTQPRGMAFEKLSEAVPKWDIVKRLKRKEITFAEYTDEYVSELNIISIIKMLKEKLKVHDKIALMCWEKSPTHCHRSILYECLKPYFKENIERI